MLEFTINGDENVNEAGGYMYISFNEELVQTNHLISCSGAALIMPDGKTKYWFLYNFLHTGDWKRILKMRIRPRNYTFSKKQLKQFGVAIAWLINNFISQNN